VVKKKTKFDDAISEMADRIGRNFCHHGRVQCGIVYCLSRNDCEKVAAELQVRANMFIQLSSGLRTNATRVHEMTLLVWRSCRKSWRRR
jgi:superfamily II DNA helicase RecQ